MMNHGPMDASNVPSPWSFRVVEIVVFTLADHSATTEVIVPSLSKTSAETVAVPGKQVPSLTRTEPGLTLASDAVGPRFGAIVVVVDVVVVGAPVVVVGALVVVVGALVVVVVDAAAVGEGTSVDVDITGDESAVLAVAARVVDVRSTDDVGPVVVVGWRLGVG